MQENAKKNERKCKKIEKMKENVKNKRGKKKEPKGGTPRDGPKKCFFYIRA